MGELLAYGTPCWKKVMASRMSGQDVESRVLSRVEIMSVFIES